MVRAVRQGEGLRSVARRFVVSVSTVNHWVEHARGKPLARVNFADRKPGRAWNRTPASMETQILQTRVQLRQHSVLGEYGGAAIAAALSADRHQVAVVGRSTIYRVLERRGALDAAHRQRRPAPPKGWYLPLVAAGQAELDSFDFIEDLKIAGRPLLSILTGTSLHGALADAWVMPQPRAQLTLDALLEHWRVEGLPAYAQFDNDTIFQGAHQYPDTVGRISRACLALQVIPVFAPPREPGFQNAIEGFNALWQSKVWQRHHCRDAVDLAEISARYIAAYRSKTATRSDHAPPRRAFPKRFRLDLNAPLRGTIVYLRRSDEAGKVSILGHSYPVHQHWPHRLVRCDVSFTQHRIQFVALRRRAPDQQLLLREVNYQFPHRSFKGTL
jgi:transposase